MKFVAESLTRRPIRDMSRFVKKERRKIILGKDQLRKDDLLITFYFYSNYINNIQIIYKI